MPEPLLRCLTTETRSPSESLCKGSQTAASQTKTDSRVMFSVGLAAKELNLLDDCPLVLAIVLSASGKNIFFDRK